MEELLTHSKHSDVRISTVNMIGDLQVVTALHGLRILLEWVLSTYPVTMLSSNCLVSGDLLISMFTQHLITLCSVSKVLLYMSHKDVQLCRPY